MNPTTNFFHLGIDVIGRSRILLSRKEHSNSIFFCIGRAEGGAILSGKLLQITRKNLDTVQNGMNEDSNLTARRESIRLNVILLVIVTNPRQHDFT